MRQELLDTKSYKEFFKAIDHIRDKLGMLGYDDNIVKDFIRPFKNLDNINERFSKKFVEETFKEQHDDMLYYISELCALYNESCSHLEESINEFYKQVKIYRSYIELIKEEYYKEPGDNIEQSI